jgi:hypothetical protein
MHGAIAGRVLFCNSDFDAATPFISFPSRRAQTYECAGFQMQLLELKQAKYEGDEVRKHQAMGAYLAFVAMRLPIDQR